jgi:hypothetical protein
LKRLQGELPIYQMMLYPRGIAMEFDALRRRAMEGKVQDQYCLAVAYENGLGVEQDYYKALHFYLKIAELDGSDVEMLLSEVLDLMESGFRRLAMRKCRKAANEQFLELRNNSLRNAELLKALPSDEAGVVFWYEIKAEQGDKDAQYSMGLLHRGQAEHASRAFFWFKKAALQGDAGAQYELGKCFSKGIGCDPDREQSLYWYGQAAAQGDTSAQIVLAEESRNLGGRHLKEARYWYQKLAEQGDWERQAYLGGMYFRGDGGPVELEEAYAWYSTSSAWMRREFDHEGYWAKELALIVAKMSTEQLSSAKTLAAGYEQKYLML